MEVLLTMKINKKIEEYQEKHGASKTWIAKKLDMSKQRLDQIIDGDNITLKLLIKIALFLDCDIRDLYDYEITK